MSNTWVQGTGHSTGNGRAIGSQGHGSHRAVAHTSPCHSVSPLGYSFPGHVMEPNLQLFQVFNRKTKAGILMAHLHAIRAWLLCVCGALYVSVNCHFRLCHKSNKQHLHTLTQTHTQSQKHTTVGSVAASAAGSVCLCSQCTIIVIFNNLRML